MNSGDVRILLIDNYDSFTYNLVQAFAAMGASVEVYRNDAITVGEALEHRVLGGHVLGEHHQRLAGREEVAGRNDRVGFEHQIVVDAFKCIKIIFRSCKQGAVALAGTVGDQLEINFFEC